MSKLGRALLVILAGATFPTAFVLFLVAALHIMEKTPMNSFTIPLAFVLWAVAWLIYRKLEHYD